ncbi:MAG: phosphoribosylamine--glycine ligase [Bacteroidetes bacterium]|nr:phosphoribosylamine--glycine ligase [Bacteroidota bacterium]
MPDKKYNVLILGAGGREHTLAWKISQSLLLGNLYTAPGNAGTAALGVNLPVSETDFPAIRKAVLDHQVNLVVVGPEAPLVKGISNFFIADPLLAHIPVIGPPKEGAMLEGSKDFAKKFMQRHGIPTAVYQTFNSGQLKEALDFLQTMTAPYVIKADGLAAGKGVVICSSYQEAAGEVKAMLMDNKFGEAGRKVVIEQFLRGIELSVFVLTDGKSFLILPEAKDYKRIGEQDTGPNTGGMGSVSPVPFAGGAFFEKIKNRVIIPTINGLISDHILYRGFIFFGLIKVGNDPYVIEYNARLGDPETEVIIPRIKNDLLDLFRALSQGELSTRHIITDTRHAACIMMVAPGYPGNYPKNLVINGLQNLSGVIPFHAGTKTGNFPGEVLSNGGRILGITALSSSLESALQSAYLACQSIDYEGKYYRNDIGNDVIN